MAILPSQDKKIERLWSQYEKYDSADRPADKLATLEKIKELALETRSDWDYYQACRKYYDTRCSMNWKLRSEASDTLDSEITRYDSPVMLFAHKYAGSEEAFAFVESRKQELLSARNPRFYENDNLAHMLMAGKALAALIGNDYEFCLWSMYSSGNAKAEELLVQRMQGRYPFDAIHALNESRYKGSEQKKAALDSIQRACEGKVMALYARAEVLQTRFFELNESDPSSDEGYRKLDAGCTALQAELRSAGRSGDKTERLLASLLTSPSELSKTLREQQVRISVQDDSLIVSLRNIKTVEVEVFSETSNAFFYNTSLTNPKCSFYLCDSIKVPLTFLQDGDYSITASSGKNVTRTTYEKRSLSLAIRSNSEDTGVYVCDFMTGEPCGELTIVLKDSGKQRAACTLPAGEGFRALPGEIMSKIRPESWTHTVQASLTDAEGKLRLSPDIRVNAHEEYAADTGAAPMLQAAVLLDRSAFNPGETMHFKAVLYNDSGYRHECAGAGLAVKAELLDTEGKKLSSKSLTTNEFGSVAGDFDLPADGRGGLYTLRISSGSKVLSARRVRVDEFNLPAFRLDWDKDERMLLGGDKAVVSGCLSSYSGHEMRVARAEYSVSLYGKTLESGALDVAHNGSFRFSFSTDEDYRYGRNYIIKVTVSEESGEMLSFEKVVNVLGYLPFSLEVRNSDEGMFWLDGMNEVKAIVSEDTLCLNFNSYAYSALDLRPEQRVSYRLLDSEGNEVLGSETGEGRVCSDISGLADGIYTLTCEASAIADNGKKYSAEEEMTVMVLRPDCKAVSAPVAGMFRYTGSAGKPAMQIASGMGGLWAVVELYGNGNVLLDSRCVYLEGRSGEESSLCSVEFDAPLGYSQYELKALSFKDGSEMSWSHRIEVPEAPEEKIELSLNRFTYEAAPGSTVSIEAVGAAGMECAATVFDLSSERIMGNYWDSVRTRPIIYPSVYYSTSCGSHGSSFRYDGLARNMMLSRGAPKASDTTVMYEMAIEEDAVPVGAMEESGAAAEEPVVREEFGATLAWEPFLQSDEEGRIGFSFRAGDKLSTYVVQLFAHDKDFGNAVLRENMVVTMPVAIQLSEPAFLYSGDRYSARVVLSSCSDEDVRGSLSVKFIDGSSYDDGSKVLASKTKRVKVEAREALVADFDIDVPEIGKLGILVSFKATKGDFSDAVFVTVPVKRPAQSITEAHSALLLDGALREEMLDSLRRSFENFDGAVAAVSERSIMELLLSELPGRFEPRSENVLDLLEVLYADCLDRRIRGGRGFERFAAGAASSEGLSESERDGIVAKILACRNADGGFGWLQGMPSSARITAVVLEWCADMGDDCDARLRALLPDALDYIDAGFFKAPGAWVFRIGWLNVAEYMYVRSLYPGHAVSCKVSDTKAITEYLENPESAKLDILSKARRIRTIEALADCKDGAFAASLGIRVGSKLRKAAAVDTESLLQYAQPHGSGGVYYPNAVMPLRGLLESELYAHVMLCELLDGCGRSDLAEGIRLWIMVQKESQKWEGDFAYLRALSAVIGGSEATLGAKVLALSVTSPLAFEDIRPAGNGMSVEVSYTVDGKPVAEGQVLGPGDVLRAEYKVWNAENRSFVRLTVPCSAALRNVRQLSGPFYVNWRSCYRDVRSDRVEYWFDTLAEETTTIVEEFYVTQTGRFSHAAPTVESFYAPHYRANATPGVNVTARED